jgi:hypothetical protein
MLMLPLVLFWPFAKSCVSSLPSVANSFVVVQAVVSFIRVARDVALFCLLLFLEIHGKCANKSEFDLFSKAA